MTTTNHRAPNQGARTSWEGAVAGSGAVVQQRGDETAPSLQLTARHGFPWPAARSSARAQGGGFPLTAPLRPGHLTRVFRPPDPPSLCTLVP
jgi:hypothetical protein